jgi:hypothetical protein
MNLGNEAQPLVPEQKDGKPTPLPLPPELKRMVLNVFRRIRSDSEKYLSFGILSRVTFVRCVLSPGLDCVLESLTFLSC